MYCMFLKAKSLNHAECFHYEEMSSVCMPIIPVAWKTEAGGLGV
jgi:hypothetical protein